jgi:catechol 2,3-dioxygenase-like lactoylglutathione lyase family enzyme
MSRVQLSINVSDLDAAVAFYSRLFGAPAKLRPGYANFAVEAVRALAGGDRAETSIVGLVLTAGTAVFEPALGVAKRRIGARLRSPATAGEGTQNLLCAYLALAVFAGLAANTLLGAWWHGVVALGIAGWAIVEGRRAWAGKSCGCASQPGAQC